MKWTSEAENAVKKVPFFVRKKVRSRIEEETRRNGKKSVSLADVRAARANFIKKMSSEIKGYQLDTCFGPGGCSNRAAVSDDLMEKIEKLLVAENLLGFLQASVASELKYHHEFRVTVSECPNACSQPQIKDMGIIGASQPLLTGAACTLCGACEAVCPEKCISIRPGAECPELNLSDCLVCGKCSTACPTGTIISKKTGFRVQLGGKLGRHPRLARELPGIYDENEVLAILKNCLALYKKRSRRGERFADVFKDDDIAVLAGQKMPFVDERKL